MATLPRESTSSYPTTLDTTNPLTDGSSGDEVVAVNFNGTASAAVAVETELGLLPKGAYADVKTRLGAVDTSIVNLTAASASIVNKRSGDMVQYLSVALTGFTSTNALFVGGGGATPSPVTVSITTNNPFVSTRGTSLGDSLSLNIKPISTLNTIYAQCVWSVAASVSSVVGLFLAGSSSAIMTAGVASSTYVKTGSFLWKASTVSTATTSYTVRFALASPSLAAACTATWNGISNQGMFANSIVSTLAVWEIQN